MKYILILLGFVFVFAQGFDTNRCQCSELSVQTECMYAGCEWETNQCIDRFPINQPNCSGLNDQLTCDLLQGCAWTNDEKCEKFTQCSDYRVDDKQQCYLKDQSCVQGEITCQTIEDACKDDTSHDQLFFNQKLEILDITHYASIFDYRLAKIQSCISNKRKQLCSFLDQDSCIFIRNDENITICEWSNNQCIESTPKLNSKNCYLNTGGTYSWDEDTSSCKICSIKKLQEKKILSQITNLNSSSTFEITNSENVQQCDRTYMSSLEQNCFSSNCSQRMVSQENIICNTQIDDLHRNLKTILVDCEINTNTHENGNTSLECYGDLSNSQIFNESIIANVTEKFKNFGQCQSQQNEDSVVNQCNSTLDNNAIKELMDKSDNSHYNAQCSFNSNIHSYEDNIQIVSNQDCTLISDEKFIRKINILLDETITTNGNSVKNVKMSQQDGEANIITICNINAENNEVKTSERSQSIDSDCVTITNDNETTKDHSQINDSFVFESLNYDDSFLYNGHPLKSQLNNCTNGSSCSINVTKSNAMLLSIALIIMISW